MSNSKSDQTVCGNPKKQSKITSSQSQTSKRKVTQGPRVIYKQPRAIFLLKPNFKKKLTTEKNT